MWLPLLLEDMAAFLRLEDEEDKEDDKEERLKMKTTVKTAAL